MIKLFRIIIIFAILIVSSCTNEFITTQNYQLSPVIRYNLSVDDIIFTDKTDKKNLFEAQLADKIENLIANKKFISSGGDYSLKITIIRAQITHLVDKFDIDRYDSNISLKLEVFSKNDLLFPILEVNYNANIEQSLSEQSSKNYKVKFIDNLIDLSITKINSEIDKNFEQNFGQFLIE